jgi:hypothetical protein
MHAHRRDQSDEPAAATGTRGRAATLAAGLQRSDEFITLAPCTGSGFRCFCFRLRGPGLQRFDYA